MAYKAGNVAAGNWSWAVGIPDSNGRFSQLASINSTACWVKDVDPFNLACVMADAANKEYFS